MKIKLMMAIALVGVIGLVSCSDTPESVSDIPTTLPDSEDIQNAVAVVQTEMEDIATEIENSEASEDLQSAWAEIETEIRSAVDSVAQEGALDTSGIQDQLDEFDETLTSLGDDVSDELMSSWTTLRNTLEQMTG